MVYLTFFVEKILLKFLGKIAHWNQTTAAKLLGIDRRRFHDYYNHRRETPDEVLIKIKAILQTHGIYLEKTKPDKSPGFVKELSHSERAKQVVAYEQWGKKRSGRQPNKKLVIRQNFDELNQKKLRADELLAEKYGFGNRGTLRHAVYAVENGRAELLALMDDEAISISMAAQLAGLSDAFQKSLIAQGVDAIKNYFTSKKEESEPEEMAKAFTLMHKHPEFVQLNMW
jgi:hypothetical protein